METVTAVRNVWPNDLPLTIRLGVTEFDNGTEHSFSEALQVLPWGPNFMVPYAERVRAETGLAVGTSWMITRAKDADAFIRDEQVDVVFFARTLLANPHWPFQAARDMGIEQSEVVLPTPYAFWLQNWTC